MREWVDPDLSLVGGIDEARNAHGFGADGGLAEQGNFPQGSL